MIHIRQRGPAPSLFFYCRLVPAVWLCVLTRWCLQRGRSRDNRGPRLPLSMDPSRRYKESTARSSVGGTLVPWDASGGTRGRNHRYTSPSPPQLDRLLPISSMRWVEQSRKPHHPWECPKIIWERTCCGLTAVAMKRTYCVSLNLKLLKFWVSFSTKGDAGSCCQQTCRCTLTPWCHLRRSQA